MFDQENSPGGSQGFPNGVDGAVCVDRRRFLAASGIVGATLASGLGTAAATSPTSTDGGYGTQAYGAAGYGGGESTN